MHLKLGAILSRRLRRPGWQWRWQWRWRWPWNRNTPEDRLPAHLERGRRGEELARCHLQRKGMKFLTANYRSRRGEIDLVFREMDCLVFVEVKTRSSEAWARPAAAVNRQKRWRISRAALDYLRELGHPSVHLRFDVVEVILGDGPAAEIRHLPACFTLSAPYRYG